jgi:hypothetical protein
MQSHSKECFTAMSQDGHFWHENTEMAAFALAGISCASAPHLRNTAKKILIVDEEKCSDE